MIKTQLFDRIVADPGSFLKALFKPNYNNATQYSLQALEDFILGLGYTRSDIITLAEEVFGFTTTVSLVSTDSKSDGQPHGGSSAPLSSNFSIATKPIFGSYRITKHGDLAPEKVAKLPKLFILCDKTDLRARSVIYGSAMASTTVLLHKNDGLWHVQTSTTSDLLLDLVFRLESREDGSVTSTFTGNIATKSANSQDLQTTQVEGELDGGLRSLASIFGAGNAAPVEKLHSLLRSARVLSEESGNQAPSQSGGQGDNSGWWVVLVLVCITLLFCLCLLGPACRDRIGRMLRDLLDNRVPRRPAATARVAATQQVEDANASGMVLRQGDNTSPTDVNDLRGDIEASSPEHSDENDKIERLSKALRSEAQTTCKPIFIKRNEDDPDDPGNPSEQPTPRFGGSVDQGSTGTNKQTSPPVINVQGVTTMSASLCRSMSELIEDIEIAFVEPLQKKAIEDLQSSFTQYDEFNSVIGPPRQPLIDWPSVAEAALNATQIDLGAMKQPINMEKVQTMFLAKLQPVVLNALQGHLTPIYVKQSATPAGKLALTCFGTQDFPTVVLKAATLDAMCSPEIGEMLVSEIRRSSYTKVAQSQNLIHFEDPQKAAIETFKAQQEVESAAAEAQGRIQQFLDGVERLRDQGEAVTAASIDKLATELKLQRIDANAFAVLYQFKNYPTGEWALMLSRFGKQNTGKPSSVGGKPIGGKLTLQEVRARQTEVYVQSATSSRAQVRIR